MKIALVFLVFLTGCSSFLKPVESDNDQVYRTWVRRLIPEEKLKDNKISQRFAPIALSDGSVIQATNYGSVFLIDKLGRMKKIVELEGVSGSGSAYKNFLFFGTVDKKISCVNFKTKEVLWSTSLSDAVASISDFSNGKVFTLTGAGSLYAIDASSGAVVWKATQSSRKSLRVFGAPKPIVFNDKVIVGFPNGRLSSLFQSQGKIAWFKDFDSSQKYSDIYAMSLSGDKKSLYVGVYDDAVYKVSSKTGSLDWRAFEQPVSHFSFYEGNLYFSAAGGRLVALKNSAGSLVFKKEVFSGLGGKPIFIKDKLVVSDSKGPLLVLDKKTTEVLSRYDFPVGASADMASSAYKEKFYLLSDYGYLYNLGLR